MTCRSLLARTLNLKPLDRVQVNSRHEITESRISIQLGASSSELPFWYFQRILADGMLQVRSPSGYVTTLDPADICDVIRETPIMVRAMPKSEWIRRSRLSLAERQQPIPDSSYADAFVLYITKDRWNRIDQVSVQFVDEAHNGDTMTFSTLHDSDLRSLAAKAKRSVMPVMAKSSANYSADHGVVRAMGHSRYVVKKTIAAAIGGHDTARDILCAIGDCAISTAQINRLVPAR